MVLVEAELERFCCRKILQDTFYEFQRPNACWFSKMFKVANTRKVQHGALAKSRVLYLSRDRVLILTSHDGATAKVYTGLGLTSSDVAVDDYSICPAPANLYSLPMAMMMSVVECTNIFYYCVHST